MLIDLLFPRRSWPYYLKLVLTVQLITLKDFASNGYPLLYLHYLFFLYLIISNLEIHKLPSQHPVPPSHHPIFLLFTAKLSYQCVLLST